MKWYSSLNCQHKIFENNLANSIRSNNYSKKRTYMAMLNFNEYNINKLINKEVVNKE